MKLDACIKIHLHMGGYGALLVAITMVTVTLFFMIGGFYEAGILGACGIAGIMLSPRRLRKICCSSLYGDSALLYYSLPVSHGVLIAGKVYAAGVLLLLGGLPLLYAVFPLIGEYCWGIAVQKPQRVVMQLLVNLGYHPMKIPLFLGLAFLSTVLFFFAAAAVVQFVVVWVHSLQPAKKNRTSEEIRRALRMSLCIPTGILVTASLNGLPYWWLTEKLPAYPALIPAAVIAVNLTLLSGCGLISCWLLKKHYRLV